MNTEVNSMNNTDVTAIQFDVFNPTKLTHWVVAAYQLVKRKKYWWVVHVTTKVDDHHELHIRLNRVGVVPISDHDRELCWFPLEPNWLAKVMIAGQREYFVNCAATISRCDTYQWLTTTPADMYEIALEYTECYYLTLKSQSRQQQTYSNPQFN